jgi:hypothetical protein
MRTATRQWSLTGYSRSMMIAAHPQHLAMLQAEREQLAGE